MPLGGTGEDDENGCDNAYPLKVDNTLYLYYAARVPATPTQNTSIMVASADLTQS